MMLIEGKGLVAPKPVRVPLSAEELIDLGILAERRERFRCYGDRADVWGKGLIPDAVYRGIVGEFVFAKWTGQKLGIKLGVDRRDLVRGDGGKDFIIWGVRIQVKTRRRYGDVLVRRLDDVGRIVPITWDVCVSVTWDVAFPQGGMGAITPSDATLDGWVGKNQLVEEADFTTARRGDHMNLELSDIYFRRMADLVDFLNLRRLGAEED